MTLFALTTSGSAFLLGLCVSACLALDAGQIVIVILSQDNGYHSQIANRLKENITEQASAIQSTPMIYIVPNDLNYIGAWTVIPILPRLAKLHGKNSSWMYFCEDLTYVNLTQLTSGLDVYNAEKNIWLGYGLHDEEPSIIHHFAFAENPKFFKYPLFRAGFAISSTFVSRLMQQRNMKSKSEFSIDASHELAMFIGQKYPLLHVPTLFCAKKGIGCASYPLRSKLCNKRLTKDEVFFAVKTCHKYHHSRIPIVQKTWGREIPYIEFFSDKKNKTIPTTSVGIKNTERGHCSKTMKILKLSLKRILYKLNNIKWVILVDDDTLLSIDRLLSLLGCFDNDCVVGERYGYNVKLNSGYNYPTGGGGIAFGVSILQDIVEYCQCPASDSPDDMVLGMCLSTLGISLVHSPLFHQARPADYANSYLQIEKPVSFHKHWNVDPLLVYNQWFSKSDIKIVHTEL
ncbi:beta-1,3-glucosyltransferase isoform X3 [Rhodnius prolixus]|uniref:beta-1,3-glucosyltransferase isoform X3 n=1 Tax=Rhodnius prolixus TaxID=13249 RepID=UPI003D18D278